MLLRILSKSKFIVGALFLPEHQYSLLSHSVSNAVKDLLKEKIIALKSVVHWKCYKDWETREESVCK